MTRTTVLRACGLAALLLPALASAQGNLSTLGFGYPTGQLSTRALGTGGATGEIDPLSATNPAVLPYLGGSVVYFQAEPEYRTLHVGGASERSSVARYPLVMASFPVTPTIMLGLSVSNLLDRSFETVARGVAQVADTSLATTNSFKSDGAVGDVQIALGWSPLSWLKLGAGAHAITGDNRVRNIEAFDDSTRFAKLTDTATVGYTGSAYSAGFEILAGNQLSVAGSYRRGGPLSIKRADTTLANAHVPDRLALSLAYLGIRGSTIAVRTAKDTWSRMQGLGSASLRITDAWDTSVGADILGPRFGDRALQLRAGYRTRTLPFGLPTTSISEKTMSFGLGTSFARGRAGLDLAALHATRTAAADLSESAWTMSVGITVRP